MRHATVTGTNRVRNLRQRFIGESRLNTSLRDTPEACVRKRTGETTYSGDYIIARRLVDLMSYRFLLVAKDELSTDCAGFTLGIVKCPTHVWNLRNPWKVEGGLVPPFLFATLLAHPHHRFVTLSPDNSSENVFARVCDAPHK